MLTCWYLGDCILRLCVMLGGIRYCENINRSHKSNGIYYVVNLREGNFVQKCHDPDCKYFRSVPKLLPYHVLREIEAHDAQYSSTQQQLEQELAAVDVDALLQPSTALDGFIADPAQPNKTDFASLDDSSLADIDLDAILAQYHKPTASNSLLPPSTSCTSA